MVGQAAGAEAAAADPVRAGDGPSQPRPGVSLQRLLEISPLSAEQAAAVGVAVLHQLAGRPRGAVAALTGADVRVLPDGQVAVSDRASEPAEAATGLRAAGALICSALGVPTEPEPGESFASAEASALPLVVCARAIAIGAYGADVEAANRAFLDRSGRLGKPDRLESSREELGVLVGRLLLAGSAPAPQRSQPATETRAAPRARRSRSLAFPAVLLAMLLVAVAVAGTLALGRRAQPPAATPATHAPTVAPSPQAAPSSSAKPHATLPNYGPAAAGPIRSVAAAPAGACAPGARCAVDVTINFKGSTAPIALAWKVNVYDRCTGAAAVGPVGRFTAPPGWNHIVVRVAVAVPASMRAPALVAATSAPAVAASAPVALTADIC